MQCTVVLCNNEEKLPKKKIKTGTLSVGGFDYVIFSLLPFWQNILESFCMRTIFNRTQDHPSNRGKKKGGRGFRGQLGVAKRFTFELPN